MMMSLLCVQAQFPAPPVHHHTGPLGGKEFRGGPANARGRARDERYLAFEALSAGGDTWSVNVNDYEHYQIPDAVISGG